MIFRQFEVVGCAGEIQLRSIQIESTFEAQKINSLNVLPRYCDSRLQVVNITHNCLGLRMFEICKS